MSIDPIRASRNGKNTSRKRAEALRRKMKPGSLAFYYEHDIDLDNLTKPLMPAIVIPRIWSQGGKPYYRPGSLDPWPELKAEKLGTEA